MGAHKPGDGRKAGKVHYPCKADTRGGRWIGIPKLLVESPAYRALSIHARAALVEITARMDGTNNGEIAISQRELVEALGCSPRRIVATIAELMQHGMLDVSAEGQWRERQARQYRLTFVSTKAAPATNDYKDWTPAKAKSGATGAVAERPQPATGAVAEAEKPATAQVARLFAHQRAKADPAPLSPATGAEPPISKPYPPAPSGERRGDDGSSPDTPIPSGDRCGHATDAHAEHRSCEQCGGDFALTRPDRGERRRRFCSETCRHRAERKRARQRERSDGDDATPIGAVLNGHLSRLMAGQAAHAAKIGRAH